MFGDLGEGAGLGGYLADACKRRRFHFKLRTMFAAFTVVAMWLGWNVWIVEQRRSIIESFQLTRRGYATEYAVDGAGQFRGPGGSILFTWVPGNPNVTLRSLQFMVGEPNVAAPTESRPSGIRRWLGDRCYASIGLYSKADVEEIRALFPEAIVVTLPKEERTSLVKVPPKTKPEHSVLLRRANKSAVD